MQYQLIEILLERFFVRKLICCVFLHLNYKSVSLLNVFLCFSNAISGINTMQENIMSYYFVRVLILLSNRKVILLNPVHVRKSEISPFLPPVRCALFTSFPMINIFISKVKTGWYDIIQFRGCIYNSELSFGKDFTIYRGSC